MCDFHDTPLNGDNDSSLSEDGKEKGTHFSVEKEAFNGTGEFRYLFSFRVNLGINNVSLRIDYSVKYFGTHELCCKV